MEFKDLIKKGTLLLSIERAGFRKPTEIQEKAIPPLLEGQDVIGKARTGTGKTGAFALSMLSSIKPYLYGLIVVPTRELCLQIVDEFKKLGRNERFSIVAVYGGVSIGRQADQLKHASIVVATPGRLLDHIGRGNIDLSKISFLVLDEADRMLDMGFIDDIREILRHLPEDRQSALFSATLPPEIIRLSQDFMRDPITIDAIGDKHTVETLAQYYVHVPQNRKVSALAELLRTRKYDAALVFTRTKRTADFLFRILSKEFKASKLHGDMSQKNRESSITSMRKGHSQVLIATDVAARGIDISSIDLVINYDIPEDSDSYIHKVGRTARADEKGEAVSIISNMEEHRRIEEYSFRTRAPIEEIKVADSYKGREYYEPRQEDIVLRRPTFGVVERRRSTGSHKRRVYGRTQSGRGHGHARGRRG
ncbi:MAG: DEAD/DEAH box helicase [Candidatus Anstonellales archaeon]